jgi:hypothetical protein
MTQSPDRTGFLPCIQLRGLPPCEVVSVHALIVKHWGGRLP